MDEKLINEKKVKYFILSLMIFPYTNIILSIILTLFFSSQNGWEWLVPVVFSYMLLIVSPINTFMLYCYYKTNINKSIFTSPKRVFIEACCYFLITCIGCCFVDLDMIFYSPFISLVIVQVYIFLYSLFRRRFCKSKNMKSATKKLYCTLHIFREFDSTEKSWIVEEKHKSVIAKNTVEINPSKIMDKKLTHKEKVEHIILSFLVFSFTNTVFSIIFILLLFLSQFGFGWLMSIVFSFMLLLIISPINTAMLYCYYKSNINKSIFTSSKKVFIEAVCFFTITCIFCVLAPKMALGFPFVSLVIVQVYICLYSLFRRRFGTLKNNQETKS